MGVGDDDYGSPRTPVPAIIVITKPLPKSGRGDVLFKIAENGVYDSVCALCGEGCVKSDILHVLKIVELPVAVAKGDEGVDSASRFVKLQFLNLESCIV